MAVETNEAGTPDRLQRWESATDGLLLVAGIGFAAAWAIPIIWPGIDEGWRQVLSGAETVTWAAFAVDYLVRLALAERRWRFVYTHVPALLVLVLPMLGPLRALRLLIVLTTLARRVHLKLRTEAVVYVTGAVAFVAAVGGLAVLDAERRSGEDPNIQTVGDALWWALTTMTTVGYGDTYPTTSTGRLVAATLMLSGIALLGVVTASLASWFVERFDATGRDERKSTDQLEILTAEVRALRQQLESRAPAGREGAAADRQGAGSEAV